ncbi:hypothetical protein SGRI78S_05023 [Streptomyces griseus subsp. griseus]
MPLALLALAIGAFGIGTTEFVIMGLLPEVAGDFQVSIPTAGFLVTGYALGVVLGAPLMTPDRQLDEGEGRWAVHGVRLSDGMIARPPVSRNWPRSAAARRAG